MQKRRKNIILVSPSVTEASRVAQALTEEFGFVYARVNSPLALRSKYVVSSCTEVTNRDQLSEFGCIIDLKEFHGMHPTLVAEQVFARASNYFTEGSLQEVIKKCA